MEVLVNGEAQAVDVGDCANLAELVAEAGRCLSGRPDEVVVGVAVDGQKLAPEELDALEARSLDGIARISIECRGAAAIASSVLAQGGDYSARVCEAIGTSVTHFRSGRLDLGNNLLADVIDSLSVLTGISFSAANVVGSDADLMIAAQDELLPWLEGLMEAQSAEDPIAIADSLEYEIAPRVEAWGKTMLVLEESLNAGQGPAQPTISN